MDVRRIIEEQTEKALLANGDGWLVVAGALAAEVEMLTATVNELSTRMAMYDAPVEVHEVQADEPQQAEVAEPAVVSAPSFTGEMAPEDVTARVRELISTGAAERERKDAGLSAREIGERCGVTGGAVRGWETGNWFPSPSAAEKYLSVLLELRHGTKVEQDGAVPKALEPNGKKCAYCKRDLVGQQKRFCSTVCASRFGYIKSQNPDASNSDVMTIIADAGILGRGKKYRKYRKLDEIKAEKNRARAREAKVPAFT